VNQVGIEGVKMPFKSKAQMRWMFANHPEMAKRWAEHTPDIKNLPERSSSSSSPATNNKDKEENEEKKEKEASYIYENILVQHEAKKNNIKSIQNRLPFSEKVAQYLQTKYRLNNQDLVKLGELLTKRDFCEMLDYELLNSLIKSV
jgi:hypothetical protein